MFKKIKYFLTLFVRIIKLPKVNIAFKNSSQASLENYKETYRYFTKAHRYKIIKNKTIGVALIDLSDYKHFDDYYRSVNGKNSAAYYRRKALKRGYRFVEIDRNDFIDDIYEINTSAPVRQGKEMTQHYLQKPSNYIEQPNYRYFGVIDKEGKLRSYCNIAFYGEFSLIVSLLGHKNHLNDGIMYLMLTEVIKLMFDSYVQKGYKYIMYDTFIGATEGLKNFKKKLGFHPYRVKWIWKN